MGLSGVASCQCHSPGHHHHVAGADQVAPALTTRPWPEMIWRIWSTGWVRAGAAAGLERDHQHLDVGALMLGHQALHPDLAAEVAGGAGILRPARSIVSNSLHRHPNPFCLAVSLVILGAGCC